jgi:hypothetical protein
VLGQRRSLEELGAVPWYFRCCHDALYLYRWLTVLERAFALGDGCREVRGMTSTVMPKQVGEHAVVLGATRVIAAVLSVILLCAACQRHPSYSPTQQQNPAVQSPCVPGPGAHCGAGTGGGGGAGAGGGGGAGTGSTPCVPGPGAHCGAGTSATQ